MLAAFASVAPGAVQAQPADYADSALWVCRPGKATVCTTGLDAMAVGPDGERRREAFVPAADPQVDCFYVYPTISHEPGPYADFAESPEIDEVTRAQAGRLSAACRVFAPIYRQVTMAAVFHGVGRAEHAGFDQPYADVLAAWRSYLARDNHGRGVVLIGHSQGAILLQRLIAQEIDGKPAQQRLVSAYLAGDPSLPVPKGARVGGVFKHVPLCAGVAETGCVYVWADYLADDAEADRRFGRNPGNGLVAGCVEPAAPAGGSGLLKAYLPRPSIAPPDDPPWVEAAGQLSAQCVADDEGNVARVSILPGRFADLLRAGFAKYRLGAGWGLHRLDLSLPQGNIVDLVQAEGRSWAASER